MPVGSVSSACRGDSPDSFGRTVQLIPNEMLATIDIQSLRVEWSVEVANGLLGGGHRDDGGLRCGCLPNPLVVGSVMTPVVNNLSTSIISGTGRSIFRLAV